MNRRFLFLVFGVPMVPIIFFLLLALGRSMPMGRIEDVHVKKFQEVRIIALAEEPEKRKMKTTGPKQQPKSAPPGPRNSPKARPSSGNRVAKSKNAVKPKPISKSQPRPRKSIVAKRVSEPRFKKTSLSPATYRLDQKVVDAGMRIIRNGDGLMPIVEASYESVGFQAYLREMQDLGGQVFVGAPEKRQIVARVVMESRGNGQPFRVFGLDTHMDGKLNGMALFRPREITGEVFIRQILDRAHALFGEQDLRVVVLLPLSTEAGILGALARYLSKQGYRASDMERVTGKYIKKRHFFSLRIEKGCLRNSRQTVNLDMVLEMH